MMMIIADMLSHTHTHTHTHLARRPVYVGHGAECTAPASRRLRASGQKKKQKPLLRLQKNIYSGLQPVPPSRRPSVHMRKAIQHHISNGAAAAPFFRPCVAWDECYKSGVLGMPSAPSQTLMPRTRSPLARWYSERSKPHCCRPLPPRAFFRV